MRPYWVNISTKLSHFAGVFMADSAFAAEEKAREWGRAMQIRYVTVWPVGLDRPEFHLVEAADRPYDPDDAPDDGIGEKEPVGEAYDDD